MPPGRPPPALGPCRPCPRTRPRGRATAASQLQSPEWPARVPACWAGLAIGPAWRGFGPGRPHPSPTLPSHKSRLRLLLGGVRRGPYGQQEGQACVHGAASGDSHCAARGGPTCARPLPPPSRLMASEAAGCRPSSLTCSCLRGDKLTESTEVTGSCVGGRTRCCGSGPPVTVLSRRTLGVGWQGGPCWPDLPAVAVRVASLPHTSPPPE